MNSVLTYTIDANDIITSTDNNFKLFAEANNAPDLHITVMGKPIWNFIYTDQANILYDKLFNAVRDTDRAVALNFRCDSRELLRFMTMVVTPMKRRHLKIKTGVLKEVPRMRVLSSEILYNGIKEGIPMCSHCNKVHIVDLGKWFEIDEALEQKLIADELSVTFKVCDHCVSDFHSAIDEIMVTA